MHWYTQTGRLLCNGPQISTTFTFQANNSLQFPGPWRNNLWNQIIGALRDVPLEYITLRCKMYFKQFQDTDEKIGGLFIVLFGHLNIIYILKLSICESWYMHAYVCANAFVYVYMNIYMSIFYVCMYVCIYVFLFCHFILTPICRSNLTSVIIWNICFLFVFVPTWNTVFLIFLLLLFRGTMATWLSVWCDPYPTNACTTVPISAPMWCILGYGTGALWDLWELSRNT